MHMAYNSEILTWIPGETKLFRVIGTEGLLASRGKPRRRQTNIPIKSFESKKTFKSLF